MSSKVESQSKNLREQVALFPTEPGVYQMFDRNKKLIYIGKAKNLRSRVRSYFAEHLPRRITQVLVSKIVSIDYILTKTEQAALILENNLIKKHQPFFNIDLKDNKSYPYLWLTTHEKFPTLLKTRTLSKKGEFFGPFTDVTLMNTYLEVVNTLFPLKKCRTKSFPKNFKPCLYFHIGQCLDYCTGGVEQSRVDQLSKQIKQLLGGKRKEVIERLFQEMKEASEIEDYERARNIKYYIDILTQLESQLPVTLSNDNSFDVVHYHTSDQLLVLVILQFRQGRLIHKNSFEFKNDLFEGTDDDSQIIFEGVLQFLFDHYSRKVEPIKEIIVPPMFSKTQEALPQLQQVIEQAYEIGLEAEEVDEAVKSHFKQTGSPKVVSVLQGEKSRYLKLAEANARYSIQEIIKRDEKSQHAKYLKEFLNLKKAPETIESFDIANTADKHIIAGMVRFKNGEMDKDNYRVFNIVSTVRQNDFASMEEAVYRRYKRLLEGKEAFPDLILIDGGKGQLSSAKKSLDRLGIKGQPIISLAKREEEIYVPKKSEPLPISLEHPALQFLVKVRDETHRFVNSRHVQKRSRSDLKSNLSEVPGLGEVKIKNLLEHFNSLEEIKLTSIETLSQLPYFSEKDAKLLIEFLKNKS